VERVAKVVEVNHRLRPFKKETLKTAGRGAEGAVLYRALRVLRCLVKMPCTCLKVGGTRCVGCEPVVSSAQSTVSWITFGRAGVEMVHCPVFRFLSKVVTGLVMLCVDAIDENMGESRCCGGGLGRSGG
jgi:hypothetical protein